MAAMRRLLLLRHAKTERAAPGQHDRDRRLTERGRDDATIIGAYVVRHHFIPDLVLVSPAVRAEETWTLVAPAFAKAPRVVNEPRIYNATPEMLFRLVRATRDAPTLMLVGHNPGLHEVALQLIGAGDEQARESINEKLPTSGLVVIDFPLDDWRLVAAGSGRLQSFVYPRLIEGNGD